MQKIGTYMLSHKSFRGPARSVSQIALVASAGCALLCAPAAEAQSNAPPLAATGNSAGVDDIIVTARKREETSIAVPVAITAVSGETLTRQGINGIDGLARLVPQLVSGDGGAGSIQGGNIVLRGISGSDANPFADQSVSFNIDGVQVAKSSVRRMASMDIQQVEVLKGPQALFFGKNSPGGIISIRTADPTDHFESRVSAGYEVKAREWRGEGYISGPVTDTLGIRIAAYGSTMKGWVNNIVPSTNPIQPKDRRLPNGDEFAVRGTLKFEPTDRFNARLKATYNEANQSSPTQNQQYIFCALGAPALQGGGTNGGTDDCVANNTASVGDLGTAIAQFDPKYGDGSLFLHQHQTLASLEMNYDLGSKLMLTSVSGFYDVNIQSIGNSTSKYTLGGILPAYLFSTDKEYSQEVRLASDFDYPVNFTLGTYYQRATATTGSHAFVGTVGGTAPLALGGAPTPVEIADYYLKQKTSAWSVFGQARWQVTPTLELAGGGRYSTERKTLPVLMADLTRSFVAGPSAVTTLKSKVKFHNFSPEVTATYRPTSQLTIYGAYKRGFISGGFNGGSTNFSGDVTFLPQKVKGFDGGIKAALFDGALRTNLAVYNYKVDNLQVGATEIVGNIPVQVLRNAGGVRSKGVELDARYRTPVKGLSLFGAISYGHARYTQFLASCLRGQNQPICSTRVNPLTGNLGQFQDLAGAQIVRSPDWSGNAGFDFETPVSNGLKLGLTGQATYSDSYYADAANNPHGRQGSYTLFDATLRIADSYDRWEAALIGKNLTNKYYWSRAGEAPFSGTPGGLAAGSPSVPADVYAVPSRGREIMLRLSYKFGGR